MIAECLLARCPLQVHFLNTKFEAEPVVGHIRQSDMSALRESAPCLQSTSVAAVCDRVQV